MPKKQPKQSLPPHCLFPLGSYVVVTADSIHIRLLTDTALALHYDRERIAGHERAMAMTFGSKAIAALPITAACMEMIAMNWEGVQRDAVRSVCARIRLCQPLAGPDAFPGGQPAIPDAPLPVVPSPQNAVSVLS